MQVNRIAAVIRPRSNWEAVDLGFAMAAHWARSLFTAWALTVLPLCFLIMALAPNAGWALLLLWWLKPLFDRVVLFVLGRILFGAPVDSISVLKELPKLWSRNLLSALVFYRLSTVRSFALPVWQLEGLRGAEARKRSKVLGNRTNSLASQLTTVSLLFESAILIALLVLAYLLLPPSLAPDLELIFADITSGHFPRGLGSLVVFFYIASITLIEPFYVAAGFAVYLNRRTYLEGWDIELAFRNLGRRLRTLAKRSAGLLLLGFALLFAGPNSLQAQTQELARDPKTVIQEVLQDEAFEHVTIQIPVAEEFENKIDLDWLALGLRVLGWFSVAILAGLILALFIRHAGSLRLGKNERIATANPEVVFGLDIRPESLPDDVAVEALRLWREGQRQAALSLLYRGSIARLVERNGLEIKSSDTEGDCLRRVASLADQDQVRTFRSLTHLWQRCAYGHRLREEDRLDGLCADWKLHFGGLS